MRATPIVTAVWIAAAGTQAADLKDFTGTWALKIGERNLFVLTLAPGAAGMEGSFDQPMHFSSNNDLFANIRGGVRHDRVLRGEVTDGTLRITVRNAADPKDEDSYTMTVKGNRAELSFADLPPQVVMQPYVFDRVSAGAAVATDWESNRTYVAGDSDTPSAGMKAIFDEDQRVRTGEHIDWNVVNRSDAERRLQTRKLLAAGALHTGADYREASFVFQHGDSPDDYLLAHTLAMAAVAKGEPTAIWIAAATLDRYLQRSGKKQIFGTQFLSDPKNGWTQEPYDRDLISDALRRQLGVPPQDSQEQQLKAYRARPAR